jgi:hypothetical protein
MKTMEHAQGLAEVAVTILFSEGDPFKGEVDKEVLTEEIRKATLIKLVTEDDDVLSEEEFQMCINNSKLELA